MPEAPKRSTRPLRRVRNEVRARVQEVESRARDSESKRVRAGLYLWRMVVQVIRQWKRDRCPHQAASLSFQTVLSIVPALAVGLAAFRAFGAMDAESTLVEFLAREFLPLSREEVSVKLLSWSDNITFESMGLVGLITTLGIAFVAFNGLEQTVNHIWRAEQKRPFWKKLLVFYATATIGPLLVGVSLYQAAQFGLTEGGSGFVFSIASSFFALYLANQFLPLPKVQVSAALVGAAVTTVLSELAKFGFTAYVSNFAFAKYSGVYGALAVVPLLLVWIYWSWLMLLLGIEVAHTMQNMGILERYEHRAPSALADELDRVVNGPNATRLLVAIADCQQKGEPGMTQAQITHAFNLSDDAVRIMIRRLEQHELLVHARHSNHWQLTKEPDDITVLDVLQAFRGTDEFIIGGPESTWAVNEILHDMESQRRSQAASVSIADLL